MQLRIHFHLFVLLLWRGRKKVFNGHFITGPSSDELMKVGMHLLGSLLTSSQTLSVLCCSVASHAGDNRNHQTAGGKDLRSG